MAASTPPCADTDTDTGNPGPGPGPGRATRPRSRGRAPWAHGPALCWLGTAQSGHGTSRVWHHCQARHRAHPAEPARPWHHASPPARPGADPLRQRHRRVVSASPPPASPAPRAHGAHTVSVARRWEKRARTASGSTARGQRASASGREEPLARGEGGGTWRERRTTFWDTWGGWRELRVGGGGWCAAGGCREPRGVQAAMRARCTSPVCASLVCLGVCRSPVCATGGVPRGCADTSLRAMLCRV